MIYESPSLRLALEDQIATLWIDAAGQTENRLSLELLDDLERALRAAQQLPSLDLLAIRSAKPSGFSPGYDFQQMSGLQTTEECSAFAGRGQQLTQLLSKLGPNLLTIAIVEGKCRSAGLELVLACDYRVALIRSDTCLGFPENKLGLMPCWGGTLRLPQMIGRRRALAMLLRGVEFSAVEALNAGLVDAAFDERSFRIELQSFLERLQDSPRKLSTPRSWRERLYDANPIGRWLTSRRAKKWVTDIDAEERPAAQAIIQAVNVGYSSPVEGLAAERRSLAHLVATPACRHLLDHARLAEQTPRIYPEPINPIALAPERIGIVGSGELAVGLVRWLTANGRHVVWQEANEVAARADSERLEAEFSSERRAGKLSAAQIEETRKLIRRTAAWTGLEETGLVIEAVDEDLGVKRAVFHELEQRVRPRTILATTSGTIRLESMQGELQKPGRVAGLHFWNGPHHSMVEIVRASATESGTLAALDSWLRAWGRTPIIVADRQGRLIGRVQLAYLSEAVTLVAEGLPPELIDREMRRFGMAQGPLETIDAIGFDRLARWVEQLQMARGDRFARNLLLDRLRVFGWNGRDNEGFYRYRRGRAKPNHLARVALWRDLDDDVISHYVFDPQESLDLGIDRLVMRVVNEAAACLAEEHDCDPGLIDLALAQGMDFAPHRGGPLRYADEVGLSAVLEQLTEFTERFGKRFEPCIELQRRAEAGELFHENPPALKIVTFPPSRRLAG